MEAIVFAKTPWPILSDDKYWMVEEASELAIEAEDRQRALAGALAGTQSVCQLPCSRSLHIIAQTREDGSLGFRLLLFYQIYDIDYAPNYTWLKPKISTIREWFADGACRTAVCSYQLDLRSETELRIHVKEILFDKAYLSKVVDDKKSWFTRMEVLDLIYHQFFFTANSLGRQPTTSQYFQPLAPQPLVLIAAAIHCALSEYASGKKATVMFSQDEYQGTFCPSPMIKFYSGSHCTHQSHISWQLQTPSPLPHHVAQLR